MSEFKPRIDDMRFVLNEVVGLDSISALPGYEEATPDLVDAVLEEAGKFASGVLAPLNRVGDEQGYRMAASRCSMPSRDTGMSPASYLLWAVV